MIITMGRHRLARYDKRNWQLQEFRSADANNGRTRSTEPKRLYAEAREKGIKSGESRRKKAQAKQMDRQKKFSTGVFDNCGEHSSEPCSEHSSERKYVGLSLSNERESGAAGAGPWGPAPPRLEDLPPIPGQRDTNGGDCE